MNLQSLYDVKERLEYAAIAGASLLGEDFRLRRAAASRVLPGEEVAALLEEILEPV